MKHGIIFDESTLATREIIICGRKFMLRSDVHVRKIAGKTMMKGHQIKQWSEGDACD